MCSLKFLEAIHANSFLSFTCIGLFQNIYILESSSLFKSSAQNWGTFLATFSFNLALLVSLWSLEKQI